MNIKQDVRVDKKLAEGGFGAVFQGTLLNHQMTFMVGFSSVAVKTCKNEDSMDPMDKAECNAAFQQELAIMEHYQKNPNIVKLVGFSQAPNVMVMKYYELGDLMGYLLGKTKRVPSVNYGPSVAASLLYDLANAMEALHEDGIAHCDVKPGNILLELQEGKLTAILCDFGICQVVSNKLMKVKQMKKSQIMGASLLFSPPEVLKDVGSVDPFMADVYSFGIVAYCCASRTAPYHDADPSAIQQLILDGNQPKLSAEVAKEYSTVLSLMSKCCNLNPKSRVTMKQVKSILSS
jgi:eukaryotic-like serine/threonine-protein kinase